MQCTVVPSLGALQRVSSSSIVGVIRLIPALCHRAPSTAHPGNKQIMNRVPTRVDNHPISAVHLPPSPPKKANGDEAWSNLFDGFLFVYGFFNFPRTPQVLSKFLWKYVIKEPNQMTVYVDLQTYLWSRKWKLMTIMQPWEKASHWSRTHSTLNTLTYILLNYRKIWLKNCGKLCNLVCLFYKTDIQTLRRVEWTWLMETIFL